MSFGGQLIGEPVGARQLVTEDERPLAAHLDEAHENGLLMLLLSFVVAN